VIQIKGAAILTVTGSVASSSVTAICAQRSSAWS
jgi:hypothetical protein